MRVIRRTQAIFSTAPRAALGDAAGIAVTALLIFAGFLLPAVV
jgi:hypothetical protein